MNFSPLEESLLILYGLNSQLKAALQPLVPEKNIRNEDLKFTVCDHIQILLSSFLNEWKTFEGLGQDQKIRNTLKITSPALYRLRIWKGLTKVRSKLLAHGHRDKSGAPAWAWDVFDDHDCPQNLML